MPAITDLITDTRNSARPNAAKVASPRSPGGTTLTCDNLAGWPTASKVHFVTYQIDSSLNPIAGTQLDAVGIVSGNSITSFTVKDGTDNGNAVNDVVELLPTAAWGQDLATALTTSLTRTGSLNSTALGQIYPIGSIYIETTGTNPATTFGFGTWAAYGAGRTMIGVGTSDQAFAANATGGESNHTLTSAEQASMYVHQDGGGDSINNDSGGSNGGWDINTSTTNQGLKRMQAVGGGGAHNNLPPYIVTYFWKRTA